MTNRIVNSVLVQKAIPGVAATSLDMKCHIQHITATDYSVTRRDARRCTAYPFYLAGLGASIAVL